MLVILEYLITTIGRKGWAKNNNSIICKDKI